MKALVTGSSGFVGRHMVQGLRQAGYLEQVHVDIVDGNDAGDFFRCNKDEDFDLVVHCAAVVGGRQMIDGRPLTLACADLRLDAALFAWALRARPERIVYFSSAAAYPTWLQTADYGAMGDRLQESDIEDALAGPDQTYGWVKLTGERLAAEANAAGITTHVFRPFSGYGADQSLDYPFPSIIERVRRREDPLVIWSNTVRDFVHIDDIVGAVLAAIDAEVLGPVNICTGRPTSFVELAQAAMDLAGHSVNIEIGDGMPTGVQYRVGDPTLMRTFYEPKVTLEEGIARALYGERKAA